MVRLTLSAPFWFLLLPLFVCSIGGDGDLYPEDLSKEEIDSEYADFQATHSADNYQLINFVLMRFELCDKMHITNVYGDRSVWQALSHSFHSKINRINDLLAMLGMVPSHLREKQPLPQWIYAEDNFRLVYTIPRYEDVHVAQHYSKYMSDEFVHDNKFDWRPLCEQYKMLINGLDQNKDNTTIELAVRNIGYHGIFMNFMRTYLTEQVRKYSASKFNAFLGRLGMEAFEQKLIRILGTRTNLAAFASLVWTIGHKTIDNRTELEKQFSSSTPLQVKEQERVLIPKELEKHFFFRDIMLNKKKNCTKTPDGGYKALVTDLFELINREYDGYEQFYADSLHKRIAFERLLFLKVDLMCLEEVLLRTDETETIPEDITVPSPHPQDTEFSKPVKVQVDFGDSTSGGDNSVVPEENPLTTEPYGNSSVSKESSDDSDTATVPEPIVYPQLQSNFMWLGLGFGLALLLVIALIVGIVAMVLLFPFSKQRDGSRVPTIQHQNSGSGDGSKSTSTSGASGIFETGTLASGTDSANKSSNSSSSSQKDSNSSTAICT